MSDTYLRAAREILAMPGGPSHDAIETAIGCLRAHMELNPKPRADRITLDDREAEAYEIAQAEGWMHPAHLDEGPPIEDEDGSIAYAQMLERQAEMAVAREEAIYGPGWGVTY